VAYLMQCATNIRATMAAPVNVPAVIRRYGLELAVKPAQERLEGSYSEQRGVAIITLYRDGSGPLAPRESFTLAHELGHALLASASLRSSAIRHRSAEGRPYASEETSASMFASHLLVADEDIAQLLPTDCLAQDLLAGALDLRRRCGVSPAVALGRVLDSVRSPVSARIGRASNVEWSRYDQVSRTSADSFFADAGIGKMLPSRLDHAQTSLARGRRMEVLLWLSPRGYAKR
jgi:Zn-dependent peptidase ImmA (M78 family)